MILQEEGASLFKTLWSLFTSATLTSSKNTFEISSKTDKKQKMDSKDKSSSKNI